TAIQRSEIERSTEPQSPAAEGPTNACSHPPGHSGSPAEPADESAKGANSRARAFQVRETPSTARAERNLSREGFADCALTSCGRPFQKRRSWARFCSVRCQQIFHGRRRVVGDGSR